MPRSSLWVTWWSHHLEDIIQHSASIATSPSLILTLLKPCHKNSCSGFEPIRIIQDNLPSQEPYLNHVCKVSFAMEVNKLTYVLGIRT